MQKHGHLQWAESMFVQFNLEKVCLFLRYIKVTFYSLKDIYYIVKVCAVRQFQDLDSISLANSVSKSV